VVSNTVPVGRCLAVTVTPGVDDRAAERGAGHALGEDERGQNQEREKQRESSFFHGIGTSQVNNSARILL
jgi:hypothetical protein